MVVCSKMNVPLTAGCGGDFGTSLSHGTGLGIGGGRGRVVGAAFGYVGGWSWDESTSLPAGLASEFLKPCQDDGQHDHAAGTLCIMHSLHHKEGGAEKLEESRPLALSRRLREWEKQERTSLPHAGPAQGQKWRHILQMSRPLALSSRLREWEKQERTSLPHAWAEQGQKWVVTDALLLAVFDKQTMCSK